MSGTTAYVVSFSDNSLQIFVSAVFNRVLAVGPDGALTSVAAPTLSVSGQSLSISGGNTVTLPTGDKLGNHLATQALNLNGNNLTNGNNLAATSITASGSATAPTTSAHNMLAAAYGTVGGLASNVSSSGNHSVARVPGANVGSYRLSFTTVSGLGAINLSAAAVTALLFGSPTDVISYSIGTGYIDVFYLQSLQRAHRPRLQHISALRRPSAVQW